MLYSILNDSNATFPTIHDRCMQLNNHGRPYNSGTRLVSAGDTEGRCGDERPPAANDASASISSCCRCTIKNSKVNGAVHTKPSTAPHAQQRRAHQTCTSCVRNFAAATPSSSHRAQPRARRQPHAAAMTTAASMSKGHINVTTVVTTTTATKPAASDMSVTSAPWFALPRLPQTRPPSLDLLCLPLPLRQLSRISLRFPSTPVTKLGAFRALVRGINTGF